MNKKFSHIHLPIYSLLLLLLASCHNRSTTQTKIAVSGIEINQQLQEADEIEAIVAPYRDSLEAIMDEVIGFAAHDLTTNGKYESTLGTFVTRLCLEQSEAIFEREVDVAIIGAGSAGLYALSQVRRQTDNYVLINGGELGTTCARVGCMPSKVFIQVAEDFSFLDFQKGNLPRLIRISGLSREYHKKLIE